MSTLSHVEQRPNLFLVGAMKAGTTSLYEILGRHPQVFMSAVKEPAFFVEQHPSVEAYRAYLGLFEAAEPAHLLRGEGSTQYSRVPTHQGVAQRIHRFNPDAKIIYIMRDPVRRAVSHYWYNWRKFDERRTMMEAIRADASYVHFGNYHTQLEEYRRYFPSGSMLATTSERLYSEQEKELETLAEFLRIDPFPSTSEPDEVHLNRAPEEVLRVRKGSLLGKAASSSLWKGTRRLLPSRFRTAGRRVVLGTVPLDQSRDVEAEAYLRRELLGPTAELGRMLGREFNEWSTLYETGDQ